MKNYQLKARTPHGEIVYSGYVSFVETEKLFSFVDKETYDDLCENGCPNYGKKWSCPPYAPSYQRFVQNYKYIHVIMLSVDLQEFDYIKQDYLKVKAANSVLKSRIDKALRLTMDTDEFYISTGSCRLCKPCKKKIDEPCAHPDKRSFSFESLGINVSAMTTILFDKGLVWYENKKAPTYTCVVAGLLTNDKMPSDKVIEKLKRLE